MYPIILLKQWVEPAPLVSALHHTPLQWMTRTKVTNARVTRWFLALRDFHFMVEHPWDIPCQCRQPFLYGWVGPPAWPWSIIL